jgi:hypothetical protein
MLPRKRQGIEIEKLIQTTYFRLIKQLQIAARSFLGQDCNKENA